MNREVAKSERFMRYFGAGGFAKYFSGTMAWTTASEIFANVWTECLVRFDS